jgi:DNA replication protein DnaC
MIIEQTIDKLYQMKLFGMADSVKERISGPDHRDLSVSDMLGLIVDDERIYRDNKQRRSREAGAKFKDKQATIETISYKAGRGFTKAQILEFAQLQWVKKKQNLAITGPTGAGKSWIAQALGNQACREGLRVLFVRQPMLIHMTLTAKASGGLPALLKRLSKISVLIIDDLGASLMTEEVRRDLLEVIEDRYSVGSTIITSQMPVDEWHDYFAGGRIADAICDRFTRNAHRIEVTGPSLRPEIDSNDAEKTGDC